VELIEESASGMWNERPGLTRLLTLARKGAIDAVAVWKLDRFGRSALDVLSNIRHLTTAGVRFVAVSQSLDVSPRGDAMSTLMLTVLSAVAEFERSLLQERTKLGMARAKAKGKHCGRPKLQHPATDDVVRLREQGRSWRAIAKELKASVGVCRLRYSESR
jgi:DNA invertase Pin-like site-specific DNA recombinase